MLRYSSSTTNLGTWRHGGDAGISISITLENKIIYTIQKMKHVGTRKFLIMITWKQIEERVEFVSLESLWRWMS